MSEPGALIPIGGHEDRDGERAILRAVAGAMRPGPLLILATASRQPFRYIARYRAAFGGIGAHDVRELTVRDRTDAEDPDVTELIESAGGVFITGGSQLRLIEAIRDSAVHEALRRLHESGGVIAGTSAGASALGACMLAGNRELRLTSGLGLIDEVLIDQHFAQRDRIGRLKEGVSRMPECMGIGIDEDTALVVRGSDVDVIGSGDAWIVEHQKLVRRVHSGDGFSLGDSIAA